MSGCIAPVMDEVAIEERGRAKRRRKVPLAYCILFLGLK